MSMTKRFGFTLAEVLITLGIIGVVAAMTIPNLIANTNGAKFRSQFKKTISTLSQAGLMAQAQYDFDYAGTAEVCGAGEGESASDPKTKHPEDVMTFCSLLNGTLTGHTYLGTVGDIKRSVNGNSIDYMPQNGTSFRGSTIAQADATKYIAYSLADGAIVAFNPDAKNCELALGNQVNATVLQATESTVNDDGSTTSGLANCLGFIDVNGTTLPNKEVVCSASGEGDGAVENLSSSFDVDKPCTVKNDATHMTDIFPIVFHDAIVEPASNAAKYVLTSAK